MIEKEIWKDIPDFECFYQASEAGQIRSLSRVTKSKNESQRFIKGRILKPRKKNEYLRVNLSLFGKRETFSVHHLIAKTFLPNPDRLNSINHKDGNKENNYVSNLEWCSIAYNNLHAYRVLGKVNPMQGIRGKSNPNSKPVICINDHSRYNNIDEAAKHYKIFATSISKVCKGKGNHVAGLKFKYA